MKFVKYVRKRAKSGKRLLFDNFSTEELVYLSTAFLKRGIGIFNAN
jgi:hypothetical protein